MNAGRRQPWEAVRRPQAEVGSFLARDSAPPLNTPLPHYPQVSWSRKAVAMIIIVNRRRDGVRQGCEIGQRP
jgi:hypothetical protein